ACDTAFPEQVPAPPRLPDDALRDHRAGFDGLERIDLDLRVEQSSFADMALVTHDRALADPRAVLHVGVLADHAATKRGRGPDVGVVEDDGAVQERAGLHHDVRADHGVAAELRPTLDPRVRTDEERPLEV